MQAQLKHLEILQALRSQVEKHGLQGEPMSVTEHRLANAILVLLNVLIDMSSDID